MSKAHISSTAVPYTHSLRVTLSLGRGSVTIQKVTRVAMRAPAPPPTAPAENASGFWFEVRNGKGEVLYHRPLPIRDLDSVEVFDDPKGGTIRRVPSTKAERKLDLIVPDLADAAEFILHGPASAAEQRKPSKVLDRQSFQALRRLAQGRATPGNESKDDKGGAR